MLYNTLRQYEYITAVAQSGSLTEAAKLLNVSQPSLSVAITRVEDQLGARIFIRRKGAAIGITPFGHQVVADALDLLDRAERLENKRSSKPPFVLACFEDIAPWYLAPALTALKSQFPDLVINTTERRFSDLASDLAEGRADVAISYDVGFEGQMQRRKLTDVFPVAFVPSDHPIASKTSVTLGELANHPLILFDERLSEGFILNVFTETRLRPTIHQRVSSLELMRSLAAHGAGVGISYTRSPSDISYDGQAVVTIPISTPQSVAKIVLVWSDLREPDPNFEAILNCLEHSARGHRSKDPLQS